MWDVSVLNFLHWTTYRAKMPLNFFFCKKNKLEKALINKKLREKKHTLFSWKLFIIDFEHL